MIYVGAAPALHDLAKPAVIRWIDLPFPPSLNNSKTPVNGRQISSLRYRKWRADAWGLIALQKPARVAGKFSVEMVVARPDMRRRDLDNLPKPCLDALVAAKIVEDDYLCQSISIRWSDTPPDGFGGVSIRVLPA